MLSFMFVIVCGLFWVEANLCRFFIIWLYVYCLWRSSYQEERVGIPLTGLSPPHICACHKPGPGIPMSYVKYFVVFSEFSQDEGWFFVLLILVELMTITVKISFHNLHNYINSCEKRVSKCMNHIHYFVSVTKLKVISLWIYDLYIS